MSPRTDRRRLAALVVALATLAGPARAQSASAPASNLPQASGSAVPRTATGEAEAGPSDLDAARTAWDRRPEAERTAIQTGLVWTGDYTGAVDGTFGRMTFEAIRAFQTRHDFAPDGQPSAPAAALLAKIAEEKRAAVDFRLVDDAATGVRIGLPLKLVGKPAKAEGGTRWVSKDGRIDYRTYAIPKQDLAILYERLKKEGPGHKVGYAVLRADWFVIADTVGAKRGYQRFERVGDGVRGFIVYSDPAVGPTFDRVVIASAATFAAQPGKAPPPTPTPKPADTVAVPPAKPAEPPAPATTGFAATGLLVAPGRAVVVAAAVDGCRALTVSGKPATVAGLDDARSLALLSWADAAAVAPIRLAEMLPRPGAPETVIARGLSGTTASAGISTETGVRVALQRGGLSAPVIDANGRLVGLVANPPDETRAFAGVVPATDYRLVPGAALAAFVGKAGGGIATSGDGTPLTSAAAVAALGDRIVPVVCER
jgi:peptidoglycan hydrolase-like protein with peptidoglycan-binding domain